MSPDGVAREPFPRVAFWTPPEAPPAACGVVGPRSGVVAALALGFCRLIGEACIGGDRATPLAAMAPLLPTPPTTLVAPSPVGCACVARDPPLLEAAADASLDDGCENSLIDSSPPFANSPVGRFGDDASEAANPSLPSCVECSVGDVTDNSVGDVTENSAGNVTDRSAGDIMSDGCGASSGVPFLWISRSNVSERSWSCPK